MSALETRDRRSLLLPFLILVPALALRLGRLSFQPLWADEGYSVYFAALDPVALAAATAGDIHPPLYYYILKGWMALLGPGVVALRLLSVGLGVLTVAAVYGLARRLATDRTAALAAFVLAVSPFHVYYSQEVRMYALAALLTALSTLCIASFLDKQRRRAEGGGRWLAAYAIITALSLYTLYYAALVAAAQTIFLLVHLRRKPHILLGWLTALTIAALLYAPWLYTATGALSTYIAGKVAVEQYAALSPLAFAAQVLGALGMGVPSRGAWFLALGAVPVLLAALLAAVSALRNRQDQTEGWALGLLTTAFAVPLVLGYIINQLWPFSPTGFQRLFLIALPPLAVLVAVGLERLLLPALSAISAAGRARPAQATAWAALALTVGTVLCTGAMLLDFYRTPRYPNDDYRPLVRDMSALAHPSDVVVALYPWQLGFVRAYFVGTPPEMLFIERAADWAAYPAVMEQDLERLGKGRRLWFPALLTKGGLLESAITRFLSSAAFPAASRWYGNHRLYVYAWDDAATPVAVGVRAGDGLVLKKAGITLDPVAAGRDSVCVELHWQAVGDLPADGQIALHLADDWGRTWAQRDSPPLDGAMPFAAWTPGMELTDRHAVPVPSTTPPGSYRVVLAVYDKGAGANLPLTTASGQPLVTELELGKVVVTRSDSYHPPVAALGIARSLTVRFTNAPTLVGFDLHSDALRPGHPLNLDLYWQAPSQAVDDTLLFVQVRDRANKVWGLYEGPAVAPAYPPSRWKTGEILRGQISLLLAPDAPAGQYQIVVGWLKGRSKERIPVVGGGHEVMITGVPAVPRPRVTTLPRPERPLEARVGENIQFLGYDAAETAVAGTTLPLVLYWRALGRMDVSYAVFVHLVDGQGKIRAQCDGTPARSEMPTTSWLPGEVVSDSRELVLPASLPPGEYALRAGMYVVGGQRLPVSGSAAGRTGDSIELGRLTISPP